MREVITAVAKAEAADYATLPGIDSFCSEMGETIRATKRRSADARIESLMIARKIYEYAMRDDVATTVDLINETKKKSPDYKGGSPIKAHRYAMSALVEKCGVTMRTLSNWMRDWQETAKALSLKLDCEESAFISIASKAEDKHLWLENLTPEGIDEAAAREEKELPPEKIAQLIGKVFLKAFLTKTGNVKLNKAGRVAVMKTVNPLIGKVGFELTPTGSE